VRQAYRAGKLGTVIARRLRAAKYAFRDPTAGSIRLHSPELVDPDPADRPLVERLYAAFHAMKAAQRSSPPVFQPSSLWQKQLDESYALLNGSLDEFHFYLSNFGAWPTYTGINWSDSHHGVRKSRLKSRVMKNERFAKQHQLWRWFYGDRKPLQACAHPLYGNQSGAFIDGVFTALPSFSAEVTASIIVDMVKAEARPVIAELGAGYSPIGYYVLAGLKAAAYIDIDLPETLTVAAYFLMKSFPDRRALIYGEGPYTPRAADDYDLVFMPNFEIASLGEVSAFYNGSSLGEMTRETADLYLGHITRAAGLILHANHEHRRNVYDDGSSSYLAFEYPVPSGEFDLLFRYPEIFGLTNEGYLNFENDTFQYLYRRRTARPPG
jgi:putative sugar O-methyltransferase